jgi:hypothetical protein
MAMGGDTGRDGNGEAGEDEDSERLDGNHFDCWKMRRMIEK